MKLILLIIQIGMTQIAAAEIYKCKSDSGQTIYTDLPCQESHSQAFNIPTSSFTVKSPTTSTSKQGNTDFLTKEERHLLQHINRRERTEAKLKQRQDKQKYKSELKQAARQKKVRQRKCQKYSKKLKKLENKSRNGYRASESNRINDGIRRNRQAVAKFCD